jgi:hypothetical protein
MPRRKDEWDVELDGGDEEDGGDPIGTTKATETSVRPAIDYPVRALYKAILPLPGLVRPVSVVAVAALERREAEKWEVEAP